MSVTFDTLHHKVAHFVKKLGPLVRILLVEVACLIEEAVRKRAHYVLSDGTYENK